MVEEIALKRSWLFVMRRGIEHQTVIVMDGLTSLRRLEISSATVSLGVDKVSNLDCDNWDNGVYIIDGWNIVDRKYAPSHEQDSHDLEEMLQHINSKQPESMRLSDDEISQAVARAGTSVELDKFFTSLEVNDNG